MPTRLSDADFTFCTARMPRPCVDVGMVYQNKILLLHRRIAPYKGYWALAGGSILKGETVEQATVRKAKEELGINLDATLMQLAGVVTCFTATRHDIAIVYRVVSPHPVQITMDFQHDKSVWFGFDELPLKIPVAVKKEIALIRRANNGC